jgi:para-nitrobenzyl esterase
VTEPIAVTKQGELKGVEKFGSLNFRGVPYATPPVGVNRWKPPAPAPAWDGVRDATEFGPVCPQNQAVDGGVWRRPIEQPEQSEDCLTLNVWTPDLGANNLPVAVWIHGGAFSSGSGRVPWYHGHNFARDGVVCVTINYRVSAFAFLYLDELFDDLNGTGTLGIQDQIEALRWVQENIAAFGGDPGNVTIFGESAGGGSVGTLLAMPAAKGLFHKAIPQSGACHWSHTTDSAMRVAKRFLEDNGIRPGDTGALLALPVERVLETVANFGQILVSELGQLFGEHFTGAAMPFQPVVDGTTLPQRPIDAVKTGSAKDIPTLVGTTKDEWKLFSAMGGAGGDAGHARAPRMLRNLCEQNGRSVDDLVGAYEKSVGGSEADVRGAIETDRMFRIPAIRVAEAQVQNGAPAWMYRFDWPTQVFGGRLGACHAIEIPFVFDNLDAPGAPEFTGGEAPRELATAMHGAWVSFMQTGVPKTGDLPDWPGYDAARRPTMLLDRECRVVEDPQADLRRLWDGLM